MLNIYFWIFGLENIPLSPHTPTLLKDLQLFKPFFSGPQTCPRIRAVLSIAIQLVTLPCNEADVWMSVSFVRLRAQGERVQLLWPKNRNTSQLFRWQRIWGRLSWRGQNRYVRKACYLMSSICHVPRNSPGGKLLGPQPCVDARGIWLMTPSVPHPWESQKCIQAKLGLWPPYLKPTTGSRTFIWWLSFLNTALSFRPGIKISLDLLKNSVAVCWWIMFIPKCGLLWFAYALLWMSII